MQSLVFHEVVKFATNYFYTIHEEFAIERKKISGVPKANNRKHLGSSEQSNVKESNDHALRQIPSTQSNTSLKRIEFEMSRSMIIDVDPYKKSDRRETAILHYDTIHNPNNCYHIQLNWLGCTAQLIQELVQNWSRQAERCGLKLVEGSVDQAFEDSENNNPFQCPVPIPMAVPPPSVDELIAKSKIEVPAQFYEIALVRHLQFVLDVEADFNFERAKSEGVDLEYSNIKEVYKYDQYIHQSGVAFVQIRPEKQGFYWVNNRLYTNHSPILIANRRQPSTQMCHPDILRNTFQEHCSDPNWLNEFWEKTRTHFLQGLDPNSLDAWVFENCGAVVEHENPISNMDDNNLDEKGTTNTSTLIDIPVNPNTSSADITLNSHPSSITVTVSAPSPDFSNNPFEKMVPIARSPSVHSTSFNAPLNRSFSLSESVQDAPSNI
ncbi:hypothetical protein A0J61_00592 [Choanephora cucurbitarum]|uniref:DEPDC5 C-terminal domain-containing protein n=1 Tax=Choanephora cucurbitarum TaxID=101091 RepID=A0A1C7NQU6_9FUNG|nr:hypothetical protein A0J61_00592 [Choanephora cucurbitarum]